MMELVTANGTWNDWNCDDAWLRPTCCYQARVFFKEFVEQDLKNHKQSVMLQVCFFILAPLVLVHGASLMFWMHHVAWLSIDVVDALKQCCSLCKEFLSLTNSTGTYKVRWTANLELRFRSRCFKSIKSFKSFKSFRHISRACQEIARVIKSFKSVSRVSRACFKSDLNWCAAVRAARQCAGANFKTVLICLQVKAVRWVSRVSRVSRVSSTFQEHFKR